MNNYDLIAGCCVAFSDFRFEETVSQHPTLPEYLDYLAKYCAHFQLWPHLHLNTKVEKLWKRASIDGRVSYSAVMIHKRDKNQNKCPREEVKATVETFDLVCICSGLHNTPYIPSFKGIYI